MSAFLKRFPLALRRPARVRALLATLAAMAIALPVMLLQAPTASAHCDSKDGPVVTAAKQALEARDVNIVLPYVKADQEQELKSAFDQTLTIRTRGPEVKALADQYFYETAVRLHRVGEGASYTGIKDKAEADPALEAAERALVQGTPDEVITVLEAALRAEVGERYQGILDARATEKANPSVETSRERVEAELMFEKYAADLGAAIHAATSHAGEGAPGH